MRIVPGVSCTSCLRRVNDRLYWLHNILNLCEIRKKASRYDQSRLTLLREATIDLHTTPLIDLCLSGDHAEVRKYLSDEQKRSEIEQEVATFTDGEARFSFSALTLMTSLYVEHNVKRKERGGLRGLRKTSDWVFPITMALLEAGCDPNSCLKIDKIDYRGEVLRQGCRFNALTLLTTQFIKYEKYVYNWGDNHSNSIAFPKLAFILLKHGCKIATKLNALPIYSNLRAVDGYKNPFLLSMQVGGMRFYDKDLETILKDGKESVASLQDICRVHVRKTVMNDCATNIFVAVQTLPLPVVVKTYLLHEIDWEDLEKDVLESGDKSECPKYSTFSSLQEKTKRLHWAEDSDNE